MDSKAFFKNKSICTLPWSGFELEPDGGVKNCVLAREKLGNINNSHIKEIISGPKNINIKESMLKDNLPSSCAECHAVEKDRNNIMSISSRLYYHKELAKKIDMGFYDDVNNFALSHVDLRWTNSCNQACVYCSANLSSKWAQELGVKVKSNTEARREVKDYVFDNISDLRNVYLAGGEPMLMKENLEFLKLLKDKNPECSIRVNTNLSTTKTGIFDLLCDFKNVHWTVSLETIEQEYEYIRHHGSWNDFQKNLQIINKLDHKVSFNMLHFILNYKSLFGCIDYLKGLGFHDNSFVIGPLFTPRNMNILNLPDAMLQQVKQELNTRLDARPMGYLKNSYENLLTYYKKTPWQKDIKLFISETEIRDKRRGTDCQSTFPKLFEELHLHGLD
jgi:radical SAM protein with 4Fe4S-binding SPASM domain